MRSAIPGLQTLEIWGQPARNLPSMIQRQIWETWRKLTPIASMSCEEHIVPIPESENEDFAIDSNNCTGLRVNYDVEKFHNVNESYSTLHAESTSSNIDVSKDNTVPIRFLDMITQEIMLDPVILPSRNVCDRSTDIFY